MSHLQSLKTTALSHLLLNIAYYLGTVYIPVIPDTQRLSETGGLQAQGQPGQHTKIPISKKDIKYCVLNQVFMIGVTIQNKL